ncbi:MAG: ZIP family metal transporter [Myxococcota bacterium]
MPPVIYESLVIFVVALAAGMVPLGVHWHGQGLRLVVSLAAGIFFGAAFLHMIPEATELLGPSVGAYLLTGFLLLYVAENFALGGSSAHGEACDYRNLGLVSFLGLSLHGLVAGVALGAGTQVPQLGGILFLAILAHKAPATFSLSTLLLHDGLSRGRVAWLVAGFASTVPIGVGLSLLLLRGVPGSALGAVVALSAGTFLHIATDDMLPHVHEQKAGRGHALAALLIGIASMAVAKLAR